MTVFERYKEASKKFKITQKEVAEAIGITQGALSQQESRENVSVEALAYIRKSYNISLDWLILGIGEMIAKPVTNREYEDEIMRLQTEMEGLQDQVLMLVRDKAKLEKELNKKAG
jgi:transcriptional regulator with XRE-family HTH domain